MGIKRLKLPAWTLVVFLCRSPRCVRDTMPRSWIDFQHQNSQKVADGKKGLKRLVNSVRAKAEGPEAKLVSESGQGHCITLTAGGALRLICSRSPLSIYLFFTFIPSRSPRSRARRRDPPGRISHLSAAAASCCSRRPAEEEKEPSQPSEREVSHSGAGGGNFAIVSADNPLLILFYLHFNTVLARI